MIIFLILKMGTDVSTSKKLLQQTATDLQNLLKEHGVEAEANQTLLLSNCLRKFSCVCFSVYMLLMRLNDDTTRFNRIITRLNCVITRLDGVITLLPRVKPFAVVFFD